jgi:predicted RND superfamily exporter protein
MDAKIRRVFYRLGYWVATHRWTTIVCCLLFTVVCSLGFLALETQNDPVKLYTRQDAESIEDRKYVESVWGSGYRFNDIFMTARGDTNMVSKVALLSMMDAYDVLISHSTTLDGKVSTFDSLCRRVNGFCWIESILDMVQYNRTLLESLSDADILTQLNSWDRIAVSGIPIDITAILGEIGFDNSGNITSAEALRMGMLFENNDYEKNDDTRDWDAQRWETKLEPKIFDDDLVNDDHVKIYLKTAGGYDDISDGAIAADAALVPLGYTLMIVYASIILSRRNLVQSQAFMSLASILSIALSTAAAFGLVCLFKEFSLVVQATLLLLLGLGIDDSFVIVNAFRLTDPTKPPEERIAEALSDAGSAILVTSLTDFVAFMAGSLSSLPAITVFCIFSAVGVLFDFFFQITFFVALFTFDVQRQKANRADCVPCFHAKPDTDCCTKEPFDHKDRGRVVTFIITTLTKCVLHPIGMVVVLVISATLLGGGIYCALQLEEEFSQDWFVPDDGNYIKEAIKVEEEYFGVRGYVQGIYTQEGDYFATISELQALDDGLPTIPHIFLPAFYWFPPFMAWHNATFNSTDALASGNFVSRVRQFTTTPTGTPFVDMFRYNQDNTTIIGTRLLFSSDLKTSVELIETMDAARDVADTAPTLKAIAYHLAYIFMDGLVVIKQELTQNLLLSGAAVMVVCTLMLAHLPLASLVMLMVACIDVELLGYAYLIGFSYNSVTVINCLVTVGIAVDYNVHIAHAFRTMVGTRLERAEKALHHIGGAVLSGGMSTFIAILPMSIAVSYVFTTFFKMLAFMIWLSLFHGLCVLPVLLALIGPSRHEGEAAVAGTEMSEKKSDVAESNEDTVKP